MDTRVNRLSDALARNVDEGMEGGEAPEESPKEEKVIAPGMCLECGDQPYSLLCVQCGDHLCDVCFQGSHRGGSRRKHTTEVKVSPLSALLPAPSPKAGPTGSAEGGGGGGGSGSGSGSGSGGQAMGTEEEGGEEGEVGANPSTYNITDRCKYIPLRLAYEERRMLRLVEATLNVSEYTDKVDVLGGSYRDRTNRQHEQLKAVFSTLCGLMVAEDYEAGKTFMEEKEVGEDKGARFFQTAFEIARRYKILNPERMRADYGKLLFMLQDSRLPEVQELTEMPCIIPIKTVHTFLAARGERALALLRDPLVETATATVVAGGRPRWDIDRDIKAKEAAQEKLARKYAFGVAPRARREPRNTWYRWYVWEEEERERERAEEEEAEGRAAAAAVAAGSKAGAFIPRLTHDEIKHCLYSIGDANTFLQENVEPVRSMMRLLRAHFNTGAMAAAGGAGGGASLAIQTGRSGARLTHSHNEQYSYCYQSLTLWEAILKDFYQYWMLAEEDFLDVAVHPYRLRDTGQGLNRMQSCPRVARAMQNVLGGVMRGLGGGDRWIGSSVVHLGDTNVPNSFVFLDKYTQVSRILSPLVLVVEGIPVQLKEHPDLEVYVRQCWGSPEGLIRAILGDFFRSGFDGSGANDYFSAGSCIDGRLTSAWDWCSKIDRKAYAPVFKLCSVLGFDGRWEGK